MHIHIPTIGIVEDDAGYNHDIIADSDDSDGAGISITANDNISDNDDPIADEEIINLCVLRIMFKYKIHVKLAEVILLT